MVKLGYKLTKYKLEITFAAVGLGVALSLYALLPKQYETAGEFRIAYIDRLQLVEFVDISQFLSRLPEKLSGVDVKFFRLEQFKYLVKLRSRSPERLLTAQKDFGSVVDQAFKGKFETAVGRRQSELDEVSEQLKTLSATVTDLERTGTKTLAEKYYLLQFKKMIAEFLSRRNLLQSQLAEDATRYFDFSVKPGAAGTKVFPRLAPLLIFSLFGSLALAFLVRKFVLIPAKP